jgi:hypothetical protein
MLPMGRKVSVILATICAPRFQLYHERYYLVRKHYQSLILLYPNIISTITVAACLISISLNHYSSARLCFKYGTQEVTKLTPHARTVPTALIRNGSSTAVISRRSTTCKVHNKTYVIHNMYRKQRKSTTAVKISNLEPAGNQ